MDHRNIVLKIVAILNLSKTDAAILTTLYREKNLLIAEIANRINRSDRHVRQRLHHLLEKGVLKREINLLSNKRLAYKYSLRSIGSIVDNIRGDLLKKINEVEELSF
jgi:predicted DNA-binding transcriptional regulator